MNECELTQLLTADGELVAERLDYWAAVAGERTFFYFGEDDVALSYAEFARKTDVIAGNISRLGIAKGERVSVFCVSSLVNALMMFSIWKAGAVYCPVNFAYQGRLLTYQLNDTAPKLIITDTSLLPALNEVQDDLESVPLVVVHRPMPGESGYTEEQTAAASGFRDIDWEEMTRPAAAPRVSISFDDPANLIYTSGTTGLAKGVLLPHRWVNQYTFSLRSLVGPQDVIYNDLPMYHVGGAIANVCRAAWVGCEVAVWNRFSPQNFWARVDARGVTAAILLDVMIPWLMKAPRTDRDRRNTLNKVHMQPLPQQHCEFASRFGVDFITAGFGQTESGSVLTVILEETAQGEGTPDELYRGYSHTQVKEIANRNGFTVLAANEAGRKGLMGSPSPFLEVSIRNDQDEECAPEVAGQLCVRPRLPGVMFHGYLGKSEATARGFRNLWFHTGDAALRGGDGLFYYIDRLGDRIRVRGENLSSSQVEDMFDQHPRIQMCAAFSIPCDEGGEDQVVVYVMPVADAPLSEAEVHVFALEKMPKFMRPRHVRVVQELPRTATNKIEKYKLRSRILEELSGSPPSKQR